MNLRRFAMKSLDFENLWDLLKSPTKTSQEILEPRVTLHAAQNLRPVAYELKLSNWKMTFVDGNETSSGSATTS